MDQNPAWEKTAGEAQNKIRGLIQKVCASARWENDLERKSNG